MKTLVLGIGNPILSDDGIGIRIVQELRKRVHDVDITEASIAGLSILDQITGYDRLILIDSIKTDKGKPGDVYKLKLEDLSATSHLSSSHGIDFITAIELGKKTGYKIPKIIDIYAIKIEDNITFNERCTHKVETSIPKIVNTIMKENKEWQRI